MIPLIVSIFSKESISAIEYGIQSSGKNSKSSTSTTIALAPPPQPPPAMENMRGNQLYQIPPFARSKQVFFMLQFQTLRFRLNSIFTPYYATTTTLHSTNIYCKPNVSMARFFSKISQRQFLQTFVQYFNAKRTLQSGTVSCT